MEKMKDYSALDHNFEISTHKNKPCALDGSIRDALTKLQHAKFDDSNACIG
jgi:hypothetical protein